MSRVAPRLPEVEIDIADAQPTGFGGRAEAREPCNRRRAWSFMQPTGNRKPEAVRRPDRSGAVV